MKKHPRLPLIATKNSIRLEQERLNSLINSMGDGVIAVDENLVITLNNGTAQNILDINSTIKGKNIADVINIRDKNNRAVNLHQLFANIKTTYVSRNFKLLYADGEQINLYLSIAPVRLGYGQRGQKGYVLLLRDITREKSLEEERDEFISVVSHELRTPIAISEGNLSNALFIFEKSGIKNTIVETALKEASKQLIFLSSLINDLAMLSRAEHGDLNIDIQPINTFSLLNELENSYLPQARAKNLIYKTEADPNLELLSTNQLYVREIMQNFITNAIKYTHSGSVTVGAKNINNGVEFFVSDTGSGISKSDKEKIFDKFFRAENFQTRETSGTGLGLYVTMKLAKLLRAKISVDSALGKGSTFRIALPNLR